MIKFYFLIEKKFEINQIYSDQEFLVFIFL